MKSEFKDILKAKKAYDAGTDPFVLSQMEDSIEVEIGSKKYTIWIKEIDYKSLEKIFDSITSTEIVLSSIMDTLDYKLKSIDGINSDMNIINKSHYNQHNPSDVIWVLEFKGRGIIENCKWESINKLDLIDKIHNHINESHDHDIYKSHLTPYISIDSVDTFFKYNKHLTDSEKDITYLLYKKGEL